MGRITWGQTPATRPRGRRWGRGLDDRQSLRTLKFPENLHLGQRWRLPGYWCRTSGLPQISSTRSCSAWKRSSEATRGWRRKMPNCAAVFNASKARKALPRRQVPGARARWSRRRGRRAQARRSAPLRHSLPAQSCATGTHPGTLLQCLLLWRCCSTRS